MTGVGLHLNRLNQKWMLVYRSGDVIRHGSLGHVRVVDEQKALQLATDVLARMGWKVLWSHVPDASWPGYTGKVRPLSAPSPRRSRTKGAAK